MVQMHVSDIWRPTSRLDTTADFSLWFTWQTRRERGNVKIFGYLFNSNAQKHPLSLRSSHDEFHAVGSDDKPTAIELDDAGRVSDPIEKENRNGREWETFVSVLRCVSVHSFNGHELKFELIALFSTECAYAYLSLTCRFSCHSYKR